MSGRVVHFELSADDLKRVENFYRGVFGWEVNSVPGMGYTLVNTAHRATPDRARRARPTAAC